MLAHACNGVTTSARNRIPIHTTSAFLTVPRTCIRPCFSALKANAQPIHSLPIQLIHQGSYDRTCREPSWIRQCANELASCKMMLGQMLMPQLRVPHGSAPKEGPPNGLDAA